MIVTLHPIMRYNVTIEETLAKTVQVEADSQHDAESAARLLYGNCDVVLDTDDYSYTEFIVEQTKTINESVNYESRENCHYYKSSNGDFTLLSGNSFVLLPKFDFAFDMIFADPPYFLSNGGFSVQSGKIVCVDKGNWDKGMSAKDINEFNLRWISLCREKLKDNGTIWITGTYHNIFSVANALTQSGFKILNVITWAKTNPPPNISCRYFTYSTEFIIWARKSPKVAHYFNYELMKQLNGNKQMTDVWQLPAIGKWEKSCGKHPTQKPLGVLARLIQASTKPGAWILDPFSGSATTGIAANLLGRKYLGLELEEEFLSMSKARREEIENLQVRSDYLERLAKAKIILPPNNFFVADETDNDYNVPWL